MLLVEDLICHIFPVQVEISLAIFLLKCLSDILFVLASSDLPIEINNLILEYIYPPKIENYIKII